MARHRMIGMASPPSSRHRWTGSDKQGAVIRTSAAPLGLEIHAVEVRREQRQAEDDEEHDNDDHGGPDEVAGGAAGLAQGDEVEGEAAHDDEAHADGGELLAEGLEDEQEGGDAEADDGALDGAGGGGPHAAAGGDRGGGGVGHGSIRLPAGSKRWSWFGSGRRWRRAPAPIRTPRGTTTRMSRPASAPWTSVS